MLKPLVEPSLDRHPGSGKTAFERNLLPGFARWFIDRLEKCRPDYLIPAETKGARLLEAVSEFARKELGAPIQVPILYRTALAYVDPETLRNSRVMILDDAKRSGSSLARHRKCVEEWGVEEVQEAICIAYGDEGGSRDRDSCYRVVSDIDLYREYIWQLTELVCGRGLPPEVDHHVFEMRLPGGLPRIWGEVEAALGQFGALSVDAPEREWGEVRGLTLHFPELPGSAKHPTEGPVRNEGPSKVRLFPDESGDVVYVVPVSFPALDLPATASEDLSPAKTAELARRWTRRGESIGEFLADAATRRDPEAVFRILSASAEIDLVCGVASVLADVFGAAGVSIEPQRDLFSRLYGPDVGEQVAARIEQELQAATHGSRAVPDLTRGEPAVPFSSPPPWSVTPAKSPRGCRSCTTSGRWNRASRLTGGSASPCPRSRSWLAKTRTGSWPAAASISGWR